jgi:hypothetical protein
MEMQTVWLRLGEIIVMVDAGWAGAVAHAIHLDHPIRYKDAPGGITVVYLECSTCTDDQEWHISKRYPPEVIRKKLQKKGWDTRKRRCPKCVESGRKTPHRKEASHTSSLQQQIHRHFSKVVPLDPLPQIAIGAHMDAKIGINDRNISFYVPMDSPMFEAFVNKDNFKPSGHWSLELIQDSPQEEPVIRVSRAKLPPGKQKSAGIASGSYDSAHTQFTLMMTKQNVSGASALGMFRATNARLVRQDDDSFYFRVPENREPPIIRGKDKEKREELTGPEMIESSKKTTQVHREAKQELPPATEAITLIPPIVQTEENEQEEKMKISFKRAIELVNSYKKRHGDACILSITQNGFVRALIEYGPEE